MMHHGIVHHVDDHFRNFQHIFVGVLVAAIASAALAEEQQRLRAAVTARDEAALAESEEQARRSAEEARRAQEELRRAHEAARRALGGPRS